MIEATAFSLRNVGAGPDPFSLVDVDADFAVVCFQRDYHCTNCRKQVQALADQYDAFRERDAEVLSIVPEPPERLREWQEQYDLPYPLLADPEATVGDAYDQPVRFGFLGQLSDFLGRMPTVVVLDLRGEDPEVVYEQRGSSTFDRPDIADLLAALDEARAAE
jgi:peroxiredoxin Q/BCP